MLVLFAYVIVVCRGRMANVLLQYLWLRIRADAAGWGLDVVNKKTMKGGNWSNPIGEYAQVKFGRMEGAPIVTDKAGMEGCGPHFQAYEFYRRERCLCACLFSPKNSSLHERLFTLGPNDVVIHFREPIELMVTSPFAATPTH